KGRTISASAFCRVLFSVLGWDEGYRYRVPCSVRNRGDEAILFFDLDNYIGTEITHRGEMPEEAPCAAGVAAREESEETRGIFFGADDEEEPQKVEDTEEDRKSTRLNSSHVSISYAVFCLKKKKIDSSNTQESS